MYPGVVYVCVDMQTWWSKRCSCRFLVKWKWLQHYDTTACFLFVRGWVWRMVNDYHHCFRGPPPLMSVHITKMNNYRDECVFFLRPCFPLPEDFTSQSQLLSNPAKAHSSSKSWLFYLTESHLLFSRFDVDTINCFFDPLEAQFGPLAQRNSGVTSYYEAFRFVHPHPCQDHCLASHCCQDYECNHWVSPSGNKNWRLVKHEQCQTFASR